MTAETALQLALGFGLGALSVGLWRGGTRKRMMAASPLRRRQPIPDPAVARMDQRRPPGLAGPRWREPDRDHE